MLVYRLVPHVGVVVKFATSETETGFLLIQFDLLSSPISEQIGTMRSNGKANHFEVRTINPVAPCA